MQLLAIDDSGDYLGMGILKDFFINKDWVQTDRISLKSPSKRRLSR
jgi:hypothetical protein